MTTERRLAGDGIYTDGSCGGNPGPGGWGFLHVREGKIIAKKSGSHPRTTNNRMELTALIEACKALPGDSKEIVHSDSLICVRTLNEWAAQWEQNQWRRKKGRIANLDLIKTLWELRKEKPGIRFAWVPAHQGMQWNERADELAREAMMRASQ